MDKVKYSPWYSTYTEPTLKGWYQVRGIFIEGTPVVWRYWNGRYWEWRNPKGKMSPAAVRYSDAWRGLAEESK